MSSLYLKEDDYKRNPRFVCNFIAAVRTLQDYAAAILFFIRVSYLFKVDMEIHMKLLVTTCAL